MRQADRLRLIADEISKRPWCAAFAPTTMMSWYREEGRGTDDTIVLARAVAEERVLLTADRDFGYVIYGRGLPPPPAVIYVRHTGPASDIAEAIIAALDAPDELMGNMVVVSSHGRPMRALFPLS